MKAAAAWFLVAVAACLLYGPGELAFEGNSRGQFFIAERVASGVAPHISSISGKNSLSYLISGAGIYLGRMAGLPDYWSVRLLTILVLAASVGLCWVVTYRLVRDEGGREPSDSRFAAHVAALSMISFSGYIFEATLGARPKIFLVFFIFLTLLAIIAKRPLWTGVAGALAFLCWQPALLVLAASIVPLLLWQRRGRSLGCWAVGLVLTFLLYEAYFVYHDAWREQLFQTFVFAGKYMSPVHTSVISNPARLLRSWREGFSLFNPAAAFLLFWMVAFWSVVLVDLRSAGSFMRSRPASTFLQICAVGAVGFTLYDHQGYPDLFFLIPPLAIATGTGVIWIEEQAERLWLGYQRRQNHPPGDREPPVPAPGWKRAVRWSVVVALALIATGGDSRFGNRVGLDEQQGMAREIGGLSQEPDGIYAVNCTHLLALNRRPNWSEYGHIFRGVRALMLDQTSGPDRPPRKAGRLPELIVVSGRVPPEITIVLQSDYVKVNRRRYRKQNVAVWRRQPLREDGFVRSSVPADE